MTATFADTFDYLTLLAELENSPDVTIVTADDDLFHRAVELYGARPGKGWSLTDCIRFVVIEDQGVIDVLTTDLHFVQAGFRPLFHP